MHQIAGISPDLPECSPGERSYFSFLHQSRFFVVTGACYDGVGVEWYPRDRIVVCDEDRDCPQRSDAAFECKAGLCQDVDAPDNVNYIDAIELCFGDRPRSPTEKWTMEMFEGSTTRSRACARAIG